mmetsp:Transcript_4251/g.7176  ORF Transcript_4251/g.7176 Transcript_4251/m.7176 type:complete len:256 (+) Transcript_4251:30-797(+)|eukprot:CAMPEP_0202711432 /NCGR_PEP_ID=MMETSP1385-20130828/23245_1 /ASSEMBLY_ACC=CAM_ASM_000861 /TAXON_ID=933848 /ORGANISM="Elphidium margaritaceum" /LENGTH=255 /DNA_ID=CAMNT_0049371171 /DNA_START=19 /DNA_END=786 /DNA_ORIENTATION=-
MATESFIIDNNNKENVPYNCNVKDRCSSSKRLVLGGVLFIFGAILFGLSVEDVIVYNQWRGAVDGECQYIQSLAISCHGSRSCDGWRIAHNYLVSNITAAFDECAMVTYTNPKESCVCNTAMAAQFSIPDNADDDWHACAVKDCDTVQFDSVCSDSQYRTSSLLFGFGVVIICVSFPLCIYGRKRRHLDDDDDDAQMKNVQMSIQNHATAARDVSGVTKTGTSTASPKSKPISVNVHGIEKGVIASHQSTGSEAP